MIVDVIYSWCFEQRLNMITPRESLIQAEAIIKISPALSAFVDYRDGKNFELKMKRMVVSVIRRVLIHSFLRSYELSIKVWNDVLDLLKAGPNAVIKTLLTIQMLVG